MAYVITPPCVGEKNGACIEVCPVNCIHPTPHEDGDAAAEQRYIDPVVCIDCGACEPACPVQAIFPLPLVPAEWHAAVALNRNWKHE